MKQNTNQQYGEVWNQANSLHETAGEWQREAAFGYEHERYAKQTHYAVFIRVSNGSQSFRN